MIQIDITEPAIIVSSDSHIGPRLREQLRDYCPKKYLDDYDDFLRVHEAAADQATNYQMSVYGSELAGDLEHSRREKLNLRTAGHHDMDSRLEDMNFEGIAAEIVFHGSKNGEPMPFRTQAFAAEEFTSRQMELIAVGCHMYNQWLADACSVEPERHVGLAQIPAWDIEASTREVRWAAAAGLRGVNFPAPAPRYPQYNNLDWEPFWTVCEELRLPLTTHAGGGSNMKREGPGAREIYNFEEGGHVSRRAFAYLAFGGVFARHPDLTLVFTEQPGVWWRYLLVELDSIYRRETASEVRGRVEAPSFYFANNVYIGASFMSHHEAVSAVEDGLAHRFMWGSDYPHAEGTYLFPQGEVAVPISRLALRDAFHDLPVEDVAWMAGESAARCYGLDVDALREVARRISAPLVGELTRPNDTGDPVTDEAIQLARVGSSAFRVGEGAWG